MVLLRHPLVFTRKGKEEVAIQSGPTLIEIKHGGSKKIEQTYTTNEGKENKCAVYKDFKHKIPIDMRNYIDKNSELLEVIRVEDIYLKNKVLSANNILEMNELSKVKKISGNSTGTHFTSNFGKQKHQSEKFLNIPNIMINDHSSNR